MLPSSTISELPLESAKHRAPRKARDLFPLPLAPFEWLYALDDSPEYPSTFFGELTFTGEVSRPALVAAWALALARHPLLTARIDASHRGLRWIAANASAAQLDIQPHEVPIVPSGGPGIDLQIEPGVRLWVRSGANRTYFLIQFHHACCDGNGAMRFIADLLLAYAAEATSPGSDPQFDVLDSDLLHRRAHFRPGSATHQAKWRELTTKLHEAYSFHTCRPQVLAAKGPPREHASENVPFPGTVTRVLGEEASQAIQGAVDRSGGTINDAALALAFRAMSAWNNRHGSGGGNNWLQIIVPTDFRERHDLRMPAANRISLHFVARRLSDCRSLDPLLASVQREMRRVKQTRLSLDLLHGLAAVQMFPTAVRAFLRWRRSLATAVLTNMSDPTRLFRGKFPRDGGRLVIGDLIFEGITGSPPLRSGTRLGLGIGKYNGRVILNAKCDPRWFSGADTAQFLDDYVKTWLDWSERS
jgi:hypothetical protein